MKIAVLALFKDVGEYLTSYLLPLIDEIISADTTASYTFYFLENDSRDNTREALQTFFKTHEGMLYTLDNVKTDSFAKDGVTYNRVKHFVYLRNYLLDATQIYIQDVDYVCILDADTQFQANTLTDLRLVLEENKDIVMVSPYQLEYTNKFKLSKMIHPSCLEGIADNEIFTLGHNYDTFALQYASDDTIAWPFCRFARCNFCKHRPEYRVESTETLVDVHACFNGITFIKAEAFKLPTKLRYSTLNLAGRAMALCEHVLFCRDLRMITNKRIVIAQDIIINIVTLD